MVSLNCLADVCLIPIGTGHASVLDEVTLITQLARELHLSTTLHSAGTTIEGPWSEVMDLIGQMHEKVHQHGVIRIQSDIRVFDGFGDSFVNKVVELPLDYYRTWVDRIVVVAVAAAVEVVAAAAAAAAAAAVEVVDWNSTRY
ncbi:hypothetical protein QCA50_018334 [Cerrena zonata]|uniref:Thiamine-binding protein domain-containing protein n=1 Tax=Cerrena zonata TaxID=2478898 RepID=A0AAW0FD90_9APHY